jgi:hypothetical protein
MTTAFSITKTIEDSDFTVNYSAELTDGTATITITDSGGDIVLVQPWKCNGDGTRTDWSNEAEVVTWFKEQD